MKILVSGFVVFVIWCFISAWLYNDKLLPVLNNPVAVQAIPDSQKNEADSIANLYASMPKDLMIFFEFDKIKFNIDPRTESSIAELKTWLEKYPSSFITITGHSDLVGTSEYNKSLGLKRAEAAGKYLQKMGIPATKITITSEGENKPLGDYLTKEGRAKNRRTQISIKMK